MIIEKVLPITVHLNISSDQKTTEPAKVISGRFLMSFFQSEPLQVETQGFHNLQ
jgi:hypothetical protein